MRILMISDVYFPRINGVSTSIQTFRQELQQAGHTVVLLAPQYEPEDKDEPDLIRIASRKVIVDPEDRMMKYRDIIRLTDKLRSHQFDIIHIHTPFVAHYAGISLSRELNIPVLETYHTLFEEYLYHYVRFLPKKCLRFAARWFTHSQCNEVDAVVVPSKPMEDTLRGYNIQSRLEIIPTGLKMTEFESGNGKKFRQQYSIPDKRPTLVHVGRVAFEKNIDFLLHVTSKVKSAIPDILLVIAGEGPALNHLKKLSTELALQDNILFVGYLSRENDLLDCYCAGDAFVFASRTETQGLVLLEAMALGVPVISTAIMGTRDILNPGKGAIVPDDDLDDFSDKTIALLQNADRRQQLGIEGRLYAATWSSAALADKMQGLYNDLTKQCKRSDPSVNAI